MRLLRWLFISALSLLLLVFGALLLLQSKWTKDQLAEVLQEVALQAGIQLSIEKIEGELPLKWTFSNVRAVFPAGDTIEVDRLQLRLALLPLLRGHLGVSYLHADHTQITYKPGYAPAATPSSPFKMIGGSFSLRSASFDEIIVMNRTTKEEATYHLRVHGKWYNGGKSFYLDGSLHSDTMDLNLFCEGSQRLDHLQTNIELAVRSQDAFAPFFKLPAEMAFEMKSSSEGSWLTWQELLFSKSALSTKPISGDLDINVSHLVLPDTDVGYFGPQTFQLASKFSLFADRSWNLPSLAILSRFIQLQGSAEFTSDGLPKTIYTTLSVPDFSLVSKHLKGSATGELDLHDERCYLTMRAPEFTVDNTTFSQGKLELLAQVQKDVWTAAMQMSGEHPILGYKASSEFYWTPKKLFEIKSFDFISNIGRLSGDLKIQDLQNITGGLSFQIINLAPLSDMTTLDLAGQMGGELIFEGKELSCRALAKHLKVNQFISNRVDFDVTHVNLASPLQGKLKATSDEAYFYDIHFNSFDYEMGWNTIPRAATNCGFGLCQSPGIEIVEEGDCIDLILPPSSTTQSRELSLKPKPTIFGRARYDWNYKLQANGDWKGPYDIFTEGTLSYAPGQFKLFCSQLTGKVLDKSVVLQRSFNFETSKDRFKIDDLDLTVGEGHLSLSTNRDTTIASLKMNAEHFPLDFLTIFTPRLSLKGTSSLDIDLEGKKNELAGHVNILLEHADIYPAGSKKAIQTKGSLQAHVENNVFQLHTNLVATDQQLCEISLSGPIHFELEPLKVTIPGNKPISGQCTIEGFTEQLFDFINLGSQRVGGFISTHLLLSGTLDEPHMHGPLAIQGGFYENYFVGISIKDADVSAQAAGRKLVIEKAVATDGEKGTSESTGVVHLAKGLPFTLEGTINHFRVIRFDWLTGACSGPYTIEGNLRGAIARGNLTLDEADVTIPDELPSDLPTLPIAFINEPEAHLKKFHYSEPYPFRYDLNIHGDHDLHLSGRGLDAELEGDIHMTGQNLAVIASGALYTKKGKFSFAGKDFIINKGEILFTEDKSFMNITSTVDYPGLTVTVHFRGNLRAPQLIFESNPSLPTSSILARILFNKDVTELSAAQALQLANTIVTLSGSSGPNVLDTIRKNLGVDRLSISTSEETGQVSVQIGKYITRGVMISLTQSTESSHVKVEVELKAGFVLEAETQEDNQGKFSFKWNKNY